MCVLSQRQRRWLVGQALALQLALDPPHLVRLIQAGDRLARARKVVELAAFGGLADLPVDPPLPAHSRWLAFCHRAVPVCRGWMIGRPRAPSSDLLRDYRRAFRSTGARV